MSGRKDAAREALNRVQYLHPAQHEPILAEFDRAGLLDDLPKNAESGGRVRAAAADLPKRPLLTPLQASQAKGGANKDLLRSVQARAARMGFSDRYFRQTRRRRCNGRCDEGQGRRRKTGDQGHACKNGADPLSNKTRCSPMT
jgi:hypothetical protein